MELINPYDSILIAIQFKNFYQKIGEEMRANSLLKNKNFNVFVEQIAGNSGIQFTRSQKGLPPANVLLSPLRIQYEELNIDVSNVDSLFDIVKFVYEEYKKITPEGSGDDIDFSGAIVRASYNLTEDNVSMLNEKLKINKNLNYKTTEFKLNYHDSNKFNYNISFLVNFETQKMTVVFDVNDRYQDSHVVENIKTILKTIKEQLNNPDDLLKLLWQNQ
mgnify:CR=1 FL=1